MDRNDCEAVVRKLAATPEPLTDDGFGQMCMVCFMAFGPHSRDHEPDCPWQRAVTLVQEVPDGPA